MKILALSGSPRHQSFNRLILQTAVRGAEKAGAEVTLVDLRDLPMPVYSPDDEERSGLDLNAVEFQRLLSEHDGFLIASPEYNGSLTGMLKNAIDWASRPSEIYPRSKVFQGKFAAIMSSSPGSFGGVRSLSHLRAVLTSIGVYVLPTEIAVPFVDAKLAGDGSEMTDEKTKTTLENLAASLVEVVSKTRFKKDFAKRANS